MFVSKKCEVVLVNIQNALHQLAAHVGVVVLAVRVAVADVPHWKLDRLTIAEHVVEQVVELLLDRLQLQDVVELPTAGGAIASVSHPVWVYPVMVVSPDHVLQELGERKRDVHEPFHNIG